LTRFIRFVRSEYNYTVADLGRGVTRVNVAAMADLDCTCLITSMDIPALHLARKTIRTLLNGGCTSERLHLIVNNVPRRQEVSTAELEKMIDFPVYATVPLDPEAIADSYSQDGIVAPNTPLGKQISALAARLTGQAEKETKKFWMFARA
jgi:Flp pilus assembly CpaE family ATPase